MSLMTLDQAITHAENQVLALGHCECAAEHRQLASWLRELKLRRIASPGYPPSARITIDNSDLEFSHE